MTTRIDELVADYTSEKRAKIAVSPYAFFRGTASLFYARLFARGGVDAPRPHVLSNGDVHPMQFGVVPLSDEPLGDRVHIAMNDFDEACHAPFSVDVKRGATGFEILGRQLAHKDRAREEMLHAFVHGYIDELKRIGDDARRADVALARDVATGEAKRLLDEARRVARTTFLEHYTDGHRFRVRDNVKPAADLLSPVRAALVALSERVTVRAVARRLGSGTASAGLPRYFVLVHVDGEDGILEVKLAAGSTLRGFVVSPPLARTTGAAAARAQRQLASSWASAVELEGKSFLVRERCPAKATIPGDALPASLLSAWAASCGMLLARAHGRSTADAARLVRASLVALKESKGKGAFAREVTRFAVAAADQNHRDHAGYATTMTTKAGRAK